MLVVLCHGSYSRFMDFVINIIHSLLCYESSLHMFNHVNFAAGCTEKYIYTGTQCLNETFEENKGNLTKRFVSISLEGCKKLCSHPIFADQCSMIAFLPKVWNMSMI